MLHYTFQGERSLLALHQSQSDTFPFLLDSVSKTNDHRFSLLFAYPQQHLSVRCQQGEINFLQQLDQQWHNQQVELDRPSHLQHLPFFGGWFLYLGYELVGEIEPVLSPLADEQQLPLACAVRVPVCIVVDHQRHETHVLAEPQYVTEFNACVQQVQDLGLAPALPPAALNFAVSMQEDAPERFTQGVERIRDYIAAGDVFQVNLSRAWQGELQADIRPSDVYQYLSQANPAPFACLADFGDFSIISSSPERLASVQGDEVNTRPIAGTRARSQDPIEDQRLLNELIAHPKERAEHIMLIDLERNDLGRICRYGSIEANELMVIESYQHVHHIVSNVRGRLAEKVTPGHVIRAVFPGGTITGCPKVRCMEIITELEQTGRGAYTGSVGYLNHNGDMDLNILIRTFTQKGQHLMFRTGAGIVIDSVPENELKETRHKARGLLRALGDEVS